MSERDAFDRILASLHEAMLNRTKFDTIQLANTGRSWQSKTQPVTSQVHHLDDMDPRSAICEDQTRYEDRTRCLAP